MQTNETIKRNDSQPENDPYDPSLGKDNVTFFIEEVRNRAQLSHAASGGNFLIHLAHWFTVCAIEHETGIKR